MNGTSNTATRKTLVAGSAEELHDWARRRVLSGTSQDRLVPGLVQRGLSAQMARYFARHITDQTYAERRACALRLSIWGGIWLVAALLILLVVHQITGTWSAHGPWLVGWIVVICAAVRVVGGMLLLPHRKDMSSITLTDGSIDAHPTGLAPLATTGSILDFQLLGLRPDSSPDDVRRAHRELAQIWHPDRFADSADLRVRAEQRMKQINAAYARLSVKVPAHAIEVGAGAD